ncbi:MAG: glycoside hydrolase family 2 TIM barrel-domain containing protein [Armatimonadota bacterium]|nr:glycoside hydrolase family 2 TIM barrel-domain containing protein [Armatimonadota bacterium]MDR7531945.1 glycoside hydrolase family 2 TIM barrel-domain containing protein [Armatimonadota bacterium]
MRPSLRLIPAALVVVVTALVTAGPLTERTVRVAGPPGGYRLEVDGHPWYVRGVSFSINEDPDDPIEILTPAQLAAHFRRIRALGANTIRRYGDTDDLPAILNAARDHGLMVMMGFWLDHDVDYLRDQRRRDVYRRRVQEWVLRFRRHPAVLMWVLGNETWGLLKKTYPRTGELFPQREAYYAFVNDLARMVKRLDPAHPVMVVDEHAPDEPEHLGLGASLAMFRRLVPDVDIFGVNSYFEQDISQLHATVMQAQIGRPYLVAEFGPPGYWLPHRRVDELGQPVEPSDVVKARAYAANWEHYVEAHRGWNLGGNAFTWKDKHEGAFTWFGLTDSRDRLKPAYWSLREAWTGRPVPPERPLVVAVVLYKQWMRPEESFVVQTRLLPALDPRRYRYTYLIAPVTMTHVTAQFTSDLPQVTLEGPGTPGLYRVYVYVTTRDDRWVSTGSATFGVYNAPRAP